MRDRSAAMHSNRTHWPEGYRALLARVDITNHDGSLALCRLMKTSQPLQCFEVILAEKI